MQMELYRSGLKQFAFSNGAFGSSAVDWMLL